MSAPIGNKHAEKWTYEKTMDSLLIVREYAMDDNVIYLGQALLYAGLYNDLWAYWKNKWADNEDIMDMMGYIMQVFEVRIFTKAAMKQIHAGTAMFALKVHYGWSVPKAEKEKPAAAAPVYVAPAPVAERETVKAEVNNKEVVKTEVSSRQVIAVQDDSKRSLDVSTDIGHHRNVPIADTGS